MTPTPTLAPHEALRPVPDSLLNIICNHEARAKVDEVRSMAAELQSLRAQAAERAVPAEWSALEDELHAEMNRRFGLSRREDDAMRIDDTQIGVEFAVDWLKARLAASPTQPVPEPAQSSRVLYGDEPMGDQSYTPLPASTAQQVSNMTAPAQDGYPPLPEPDLGMPWRVNAKSDGAAHSSGFTHTQMRAYVDADREAHALASASPAVQSDAAAIVSKICDLFHIGKLARTESTILTNLGNAIHFTGLLHAIERDLFPQPELPEDDDPYTDIGDRLPAPNCWGAKDEADYVAQFRAALAARAAAPQPPTPAATADAMERMLSELVDKITPGADSGDLPADAREASKALDASTRILMENSGCGSGTQVDMLTVRLNPGDKVILHMGPLSAALAAKGEK